MRKFLTAIIFGMSLTCAVFAGDISDVNIFENNNPEIELFGAPETEFFTEPEPVINCATQIFANSLSATSNEVNESDPEYIIQAWIYKNFQSPDVIKKVLSCPEVLNIPETETIKFQPIAFNFPGGRQVVVNYETQPKILKQRLLAANKIFLPETDPSPRIGAPNDSAIWTNTEPAWYGILVVQHGALDNFIGDDKNNTISLKYLEQNIGKFYPSGNKCTSKSALANNNKIINITGHKTINMEDDSNDYYVAGDANLQWITWGEVALDVAITVATVGGGAVIIGATKGIRASRAAKNLVVVIKDLEKIDKVQDYIKLTRESARITEELSKLDKVKDAAAYASKADDIKNLGKNIKDLEKLDKVGEYKNASKSFEDVMKWRRAFKSLKLPQRGNVIARAWRSMRAFSTGGKTITKGAKVARSSMKSGKILDWLFHSTLKNIGKLGKLEQAGGLLYGTMKFAGDMYDWSETSTGEFTSGIEFKPLCLLSADDLAGQENVVNHGMWFMWAGDSVNQADDDAAYLQAMDFASKFNQDLIETQEDEGNFCDVDIFVVRPIIRNPGDDNAQLYYLIMNDQPWSTVE
ncbi:MAG: hypothetical protein JW974_00780 [Alphaproteobacteria bacterium]|nr:hypothetical protein [Alphaproteobacteria bacterium]MBN2674980.1 hypothetical protein [Alphaproteobacteria bacterium]